MRRIIYVLLCSAGVIGFYYGLWAAIYKTPPLFAIGFAAGFLVMFALVYFGSKREGDELTEYRKRFGPLETIEPPPRRYR